MRSLTLRSWPATIIGLLLAQVAYAESALVGVSGYYSTVQGKTHINVDNPHNNLTTQGFILDASSGLVRNKYRYRSAILFLQRNVSNYLVRNGQGEEHPLSREFDGKETQGKFGVDLLWRGTSFSLDSLQTLDDSPLATRTYLFTLSYQSFPYGANVGYRFFQVLDRRPTSYVVVPETLRSRALSTFSQRKKHGVFWEQIINEWAKIRSELQLQEASSDRPGHYGGKIAGLVSINHQSAISLSMEKITEFQAAKKLPADGSGFYQLASYQLGVSYEINYNFLLKAAVATTIETESARGSTPRQLIGTDSGILGLEGRYRRWLWKLALITELSNTGRRGQMFQGGWQWEI